MAARERLICRSEDLAERGDGLRFEVDWMGKREPAFAVRYRGRVHAYLNRCSHVPMELDWQEGRFFDVAGLYLVCGTHGALYAPESGACVGGRCSGKGLRPLAMQERDGCVYLIEGE
ncbi:MAG: Rieske 2Fe-2S domain-containing protein [Sterolibacteriaceae bacterium MAG5]|nr:Rieske 2Fe-2S domain-containing protein [Candidatus Nitricoxidireducens bremensis]